MLELLHKPQGLLSRLRNSSTTRFKAKDIIRASREPLLRPDDPHVARDLKRIDDDEPLSPVLLVASEPLIIADGYHRVCAVYHRDYDAEVHCRLA